MDGGRGTRSKMEGTTCEVPGKKNEVRGMRYTRYRDGER